MQTKAIVTGSDSGIGRATAVALARAGFDVGVTWHSDEDGAGETAREVEAAGARAAVRALDLTDLPGAADVVDDLADELGGLGVLVNNAGADLFEDFLELSFERWETTLRLNLSGAFLCSQRAARLMIEAGEGGRIVNVTSVHEHAPRSGAAGYCASKAGLGLLTKVMALELGGAGITVNAVAPGEISTPIQGDRQADPQDMPRPSLAAGRAGYAQEVADVIAFLASERSSYVTGASWLVDGGFMLTAAAANERDVAEQS